MAISRLIANRRIVAYALAAAFLLTGFSFFLYTQSPTDDRPSILIVDIPRGSGFRQIVRILDQAGLVKNKPFFYLLSVLKQSHRQIRAGEYELSTTLTPMEVIDKLVRGDIKDYPVTIPEDWNLQEIARRLAKDELADEKDFIALASNREFLKDLKIEGATAEGYLYPETYRLDKTMKSRDIMKLMVNQFWKVFTPQMRQRAAQIGMTVPEAVTLASIIGKESGLPQEKPLISAVFHNRLRKNMKLQSDPTSVYGLEEFRGPITRSQLRRKTPYNTYVIQGLPPDPIANPGSDSLQAALYPADVNYLYFVSKNDGSHYFSADFMSHQKAVSRYRP